MSESLIHKEKCSYICPNNSYKGEQFKQLTSYHLRPEITYQTIMRYLLKKKKEEKIILFAFRN